MSLADIQKRRADVDAEVEAEAVELQRRLDTINQAASATAALILSLENELEDERTKCAKLESDNAQMKTTMTDCEARCKEMEKQAKQDIAARAKAETALEERRDAAAAIESLLSKLQTQLPPDRTSSIDALRNDIAKVLSLLQKEPKVSRIPNYKADVTKRDELGGIKEMVITSQ